MTLLFSFLITLMFTLFIKRLAIKLGIVDKPGHRKVHSQPVPLLGGVSIFLGFILAYLMFIPIYNKTLIVLVTSLIIMCMGLYDDVFDLKVSWRLIIQIMVSIMVIGFGIKFHIGEYITQNLILIFIIDVVITILWLVGMINAMNFIDGLDGLSVCITFWASLGFLVIGWLEGNTMITICSLALGGAVLGFLPYNFHPAKIFMGDAGSAFLGYILGVISIITFNQLKNPLSISILIIILSVPLFDMNFVIFKRIARKNSISIADKSHIHHRIMAMGFGQRKVLLIINYLAIAAAIFGSLIYLWKVYWLGMMFVILFMVIALKKSGLIIRGGIMEKKAKKIKLLLGVTLSEMGGAQKVVYDLIASLPQEKYSVTLVTYPKGELVQWVQELNKQRLKKIEIILLPTLRREISPWNDLKTLFYLYQVMKNQKYDIAHFHSSKMGILGRWAAWIARVPKIVFTVHGWGINQYQPWLLQKILSLVEKATGKLTHYIICVSKHHQDIGIQNKWIYPNQSQVIYNGISPPPNAKGKLRKEIGIDENTSMIGTIMRLRSPKDPLFTIEVFAGLKQQGYDGKLVIVGDGPLKSACESLIEEKKLTKDVFLLGTRSDARQLLNDMDIFTLFTKWEGLPLVIMEAMFAGKPIVSSNVGGISELIIHGKRGYLVEDFNVEETIEIMENLLESKEIQIDMGDKSREMAYNNFSKNRMIQEYEKVYGGEGVHHE